MWRGSVHAALLWSVSRHPAGPRLYHDLTRRRLGSQLRVLPKLQRVWPGYAERWRAHLALEGAKLWVHDPGWLPFGPLASYLLSGTGGFVTNTAGAGALAERYLGPSIDAALGAGFARELVPKERRRWLAALRDASVDEALDAVGAARFEGVSVDALPLPDASVDLCHSGGALEHYAPHRLRAFAAECLRVLRPGGVASHVYDHRDHLRHVDPRWPFLAHLAIPDPAYRALFGHPLLYHNRMSPSDALALFRGMGFEVLAARRFILPDKRYVDADAEALTGEAGVAPALRRGRAARLSELDLHTVAVHYLLRKPMEQRHEPVPRCA